MISWKTGPNKIALIVKNTYTQCTYPESPSLFAWNSLEQIPILESKSWLYSTLLYSWSIIHKIKFSLIISHTPWPTKYLYDLQRSYAHLNIHQLQDRSYKNSITGIRVLTTLLEDQMCWRRTSAKIQVSSRYLPASRGSAFSIPCLFCSCCFVFVVCLFVIALLKFHIRISEFQICWPCIQRQGYLCLDSLWSI